MGTLASLDSVFVAFTTVRQTERRTCKSPHRVLLTTERRDGDFLGEVRTRFIDGEFVDDIVAFRFRPRRELEVVGKPEGCRGNRDEEDSQELCAGERLAMVIFVILVGYNRDMLALSLGRVVQFG